MLVIPPRTGMHPPGPRQVTTRLGKDSVLERMDPEEMLLYRPSAKLLVRGRLQATCAAP